MECKAGTTLFSFRIEEILIISMNSVAVTTRYTSILSYTVGSLFCFFYGIAAISGQKHTAYFCWPQIANKKTVDV